MSLPPLWISNKKEQFYKIIRPLSLLLKLLGFFPFQNSGSDTGLKLCYDTYSGYIHLVVCLLVYTVPTLYLVQNAHNNFVVWSEATLTVIFVAWIVNCFLTDKLVLEIIHKFETYDSYYIASKHTETCQRFRYRGLFMFVFVVFMSFVNIFLFEYKTTSETVDTIWVYIIQNAPWLTMFDGFYFQLCWELSYRFSELQENLNSHILKWKIEEIRLMHGKLKDINDLINSCFGVRISLFFLYFLHSLLNVFYKVVVASKVVRPGTFLVEVQKFVLLYLTCNCSEFGVNQVSIF